jgi:uncharacterized protein YodC (DUF2158 family)
MFRAFCEQKFGCCTDDELAALMGPIASADDCVGRLIAVSEYGSPYQLIGGTPLADVVSVLTRLEYGLDMGRVHTDSKAIAACAAQMSDAPCTPVPPIDHCTPKAPVSFDACDITKLVVGSQKAGDDCTDGSECVTGLMCSNNYGVGGVCVVKAGEGDVCIFDYDCSGGLVCDWSTGTCVKASAFGEVCAYSDPKHPVQGTEKVRCQYGAACDPISLKCTDSSCIGGNHCSDNSGCPKGLLCVANKCGKRLEPGGACRQTSDCASGTCGYDSQQQQQVCKIPRAAGEDCQSDDDCASTHCKFDNGAASCVDLLLDGDLCPSTIGADCASGKCEPDTTGTFYCGVSAAVGDFCSSDSECNTHAGLYCIVAACAQAPFADGTKCTQGSQCTSEICLGDVCKSKGKAGAECGGADTPQCDDGFYCNDTVTPPVCAAKKRHAEPCTTSDECWGNCTAEFGTARCTGVGPGEAECVGRK